MLTIGALIRALSVCKPDAMVYYDFCGCVPTTFGSWRGIYAEPALGWEPAGYSRDSGRPTPNVTVAKLIYRAKAAISGQAFQGWKGGEYTYTESLPVHVDNQGDANDTVLIGVEDRDWYVILRTQFQYSI